MLTADSEMMALERVWIDPIFRGRGHMALHRLMDIEISVPEPATLDAFYSEIGFTGGPGVWGSADAPDQISLSEAPYRQLRSIRVACQSDEDLQAAADNLAALGLASSLAGGRLEVIDPINQWRVVVEPSAEFSLPADLHVRASHRLSAG